MNKLMMTFATLFLSAVPAFAGAGEGCKEVELESIGLGYVRVQVGRPKARKGEMAGDFLVKISLSSEDARLTSNNLGALDCGGGTMIRTQAFFNLKFDVGEIALPMDRRVNVVSCSSSAKKCWSAVWDPKNPKKYELELKASKGAGGPLVGKLGPVEAEDDGE